MTYRWRVHHVKEALYNVAHDRIVTWGLLYFRSRVIFSLQLRTLPVLKTGRNLAMYGKEKKSPHPTNNDAMLFIVSLYIFFPQNWYRYIG